MWSPPLIKNLTCLFDNCNTHIVLSIFKLFYFLVLAFLCFSNIIIPLLSNILYPAYMLINLISVNISSELFSEMPGIKPEAAGTKSKNANLWAVLSPFKNLSSWLSSSKIKEDLYLQFSFVPFADFIKEKVEKRENLLRFLFKRQLKAWGKKSKSSVQLSVQSQKSWKMKQSLLRMELLYSHSHWQTRCIDHTRGAMILWLEWSSVELWGLGSILALSRNVILTVVLKFLPFYSDYSSLNSAGF